MLCHLQSVSSGLIVGFQVIREYHFLILSIIVRPLCWIACRHWVMSPAVKLLNIVWLGLWQSQVWPVFRWNLNIEQAKEVLHAAHESMFATDATAIDATLNCMPGCESILAVTASWLIYVCGFSVDSVFWDYVTEHMNICPFGILLMERHTEIEHVLRPGLFWDCTQYKVVIPFWYFGIANWSHL
jgi:hypothetical protein